MSEFYKKNIEKYKEYYENNRERLIKQGLEYYHKNRGKIRERQNQYYRKYYEKNKDKINLSRRRVGKLKPYKIEKAPLYVPSLLVTF
jgi:hypothetical protein